MKTIQGRWLAWAFVFALAGRCYCQTNIQIISVVPTFEQAIQLTWTSASNEVYEIDEADALNTNSDGSTAWNMLYSDYPSQGTNTFWLDTGDYNVVPYIVHPKYSPMRFYRIKDLGPDTTSDEPSVSVTSPTNGFVASGMLTVTVSASTDQATLYTRLYVDGQEMNRSTNGTNFYLNTCEWPNGTHILFATAECQSAFTGTPNTGNVAVGHAVSAFVPVVFNNLVDDISFSQPFFDPSSGQTQQVSAIFALDSDWTLNVEDIYSNVVKTATGSGTSMEYNWDGTGNGGTNLPAGIYYYYISAQTNGNTPQGSGGGTGGGDGGPPPSPDFALSGSLSGSGSYTITIPLPPLPPGLSYGLDADGNEITNMTETVVPPARASSASMALSSASAGGASPAYAYGGTGSPGYITPLPNPQTNPPAPQRPPTAPIRGIQGTFGLAYQTYGTNGISVAAPDNGLHIGQRVQIQGGTTNFNFPRLGLYRTEGNNFVNAMQKGGWSQKISKVDNQLQISDLTGSSNVFNGVNLGLMMLHGVYGTSPDYNGNANGTQGIYFPLMNNGNPQYVRFSAMTSFGSPGTNGLKWMAVHACYSLKQSQWTTMVNNNIDPVNNNLHMLLGCASVSLTDSQLPALWAQYMLGSADVQPLDVRNSWHQAATDAFYDGKPPVSITFAAAGFNSCKTEDLNSTNSPSGGMFYDSATVYTP